MEGFKKKSPVRFASQPVQHEERSHWVVVRRYENEGQGPWLVDLSHKTRWDFQDSQLDQHTPDGTAVPSVPGNCLLQDHILVNRMNRTQVAIWHLGDHADPILPAETGYTDVTDATVFLALFGPHLFSITQKLSALDFRDPGQQIPFLLQGPFSRVPCQVAVIERGTDRCGILLTCSRGYARDMVSAILAAGAAAGLHPAGEDRFTTWLAGL